MAHGFDIRNLDIYKNCGEAIHALAQVTSPKLKFSALDELTTKAFHNKAFTVLEELGKDHSLSQYAENSGMRYGLNGFGANISIATVETIVHNCMQLSKKVMESINPEEKSRLYSVCSKPDTYIESKAIHALEKFINSDNFKSSPCSNHPMHEIHKQYQKLLPFRHQELCPCHKYISQRLQGTASYAKTSHFKNPYFPPPVTLQLEKGETLGICFPPHWENKPLLFTSNDNKIWDVEFPIGEEFKYVIVKDGNVRYEHGPNRLFKTLGDALQTTPEDERPKFL